MDKINWKSYELVVFDLDNTLTGSKIPMDKEMAILFTQLLDFTKVAVISGGNFQEFDRDLLSPLSTDANFSNLHLFPTDGTAYYKWQGGWKNIYTENLSTNSKKIIKDAFRVALDKVGFKEEKIFGELIEDRGSSIVFSALGQEAPLELKKKWDPDQRKRFEIKKILDELIPEFEVNVAGTTSIDVTAKDLDKAYGIRKMIEYIKVPVEKMIFMGDALFPGGNDNDVLKTGIKAVAVSGPEDTKKIIKEIINNLQ